MKAKVFPIALILVVVAGLLFSRPRAIETLPPCPISLTNPDGQSLTLEKYDLRVAVDGPLSLTEMEMVFRNPEKRQMEGRFLYMLPPGATISRFAKEVNGKLMEGEVVEKLRAQSVYTQVLQSMRDPALLEMDQGNRFSARVFPIAPEGTVRLLLSYSQVVPTKDGERKLTIPLAGIPKISQFSYSAVVNDVAGQKFEPIAGFNGQDNPQNGHRVLRSTVLSDYTPQADLVLTFHPESPDKQQIRAITAGNYQMLSFTTPQEYTKRSQAPKDWNFYFDTSASNADTAKQRLSAIKSLLASVEDRDGFPGELSVSAFDVDVTNYVNHIKHGQKDSAFQTNMPELLAKLEARHFLGATNLEAALKHIGDAARAEQQPQNFVLVSDGIATLGAREIRELLAALGDWPERHVLHALVIGSKQDEKTLNAIVEKTNGRVVTLPLTDHVNADIPRVISELTEPLGKSYEFYDESAAWIYPKTFRDVRGATELVVFSQLKEGAKSKPGVVARAVGAKPVDTALTTEPTQVPDFAPLLQREAIRAYLDQLEKSEQAQTDNVKRAEIHKQRIDLSEKNRVLCPLTSLLVLETENDYARFGIERTSLADIMTVSDSGIGLKHRTAEDVPSLPPQNRMRGGKSVDAQKPRAKAQQESLEKTKAFDKNDSVNEEAEGADEQLAVNGLHRLTERQGASSGRAGFVQGGDAAGDDDRAVDGARRELAAPAGAANARRLAPSAPPPPTPVSTPPATHQALAADPQLAQAQSRAEASVASAAPAADRAARDELRQDSAGVNRAQGTLTPAPEWTRQFATPPPAADLNALHGQVAASPRDRGLRNAYANALFAAKKWDELQGQAFEWLPFDPENPQVFEYLGKSATGLGDNALALRAMTSIAEVAPNRAALLARAGWLLLTADKYEMAEQMFREALKNRKDDPNIYRGLGLTLWLSEKYDVAARELDAASQIDFHNRYGDVRRVLREELGYVLRAWAQKDQAAALNFAQLHNAEQDMRRADALRVTMGWETDANDVDLHVVDPNGEECFYSHMHNASGLELYSDQTQGLGPEVIRTEKALPGTYSIGVTYFNAGPMGVSRGVVVIMKPEDGIVKHPQIVPFCLIPTAVGGQDIRMVGEVKF